jgi:hypothetical protein
VADFGNINAKLAGLENGMRTVLGAIFEYVLKDIRFGRAEDGSPSKNFGGGFFQGVTPGVANTEFNIVHTFGRKPYLLVPVLPLDAVNAKVVRLQVSRAADSSRIYLKSPDTDATFRVYVEG